MPNIPDVFIIESLDPDDEGNGRFEGSILCSMLRLHGKQPKYRYVRTRKQFLEAVNQFGKSNYRYLHISAHADEDGMSTTNQEEIDYDELAEILRPHLKGCRIFLSACSMVHEDLAAEMIPKTGCYSVVGPTDDIFFTDAAIVWSSIYHLMFTNSSDKMSHVHLKRQLSRVCKLFDVDLAYYSRSKVLKRGYTKDLLCK
jgi:hypothetical protein